MFPFSFFKRRKVKPAFNDGPYRTAAEMPPQPIHKEPKVKRSFKMPSIKLGKHTKTFGFLSPVSACAVAIGMIYDAPLLGSGIKWGLYIGIGVVAAFFLGMSYNNIANNEKA